MSSTVILPEPPEGPEPAPGGRRTTVVAAITAGTLAVVGIGAYAAVQFLSGGAGAETAMPAESTLAVVSLDLDPSAKQKIEALKTLQKFPALKKELDISSGDDLRQKFFDGVLKDGDCKHLSYESDIKPWIGDNVAIAASAFEKGKISPLVSLAVTDQDKAARGLDALITCSHSSKDTAYAFNGDFLLITDSQAHADLAVSQAKAHALSDDAGYKTWTGKVGDRGIVNFYVAKAAAAAFGDYAVDYAKVLTPSPATATAMPSEYPSSAASSLPSDGTTEMPVPGTTTATLPGMNPTPGTIQEPGATITASPATGSGSNSSAGGMSAPYTGARDDDSTAAIRKALKNFQGAAGALRFADGGAELQVVGRLTDQPIKVDHPVSEVVDGLPADTAAVIAAALPKDWASKLTTSLEQFTGSLFGSGDITSLLRDQFGLTLPDDLETLVGDGLAFAVRGTPPDDLSAVSGPEQIPAGLVIKGDPAAIKAVLAKIERASGTTMKDAGVTVTDGDGKVALSFHADYAKSMVGGGSLGDDNTFQKLVPEAGKSSAVFYVDFNSKWRDALGKAIASGDASSKREAEMFLANTAPLEAFAISGWADGADTHYLVKLTTD